MFEIPENLPLRLGPLAWLIGSWQGWGTLVGQAGGADDEGAQPAGAGQANTDGVDGDDSGTDPIETAPTPGEEVPSDGTGAEATSAATETTNAQGADPGLVDAPILQHIQADIVGEQLRVRVSVFAGHVAEPIDPTWTAAQGLDHIIAGDLMWEETSYWEVTSPLALVPAGQDEPRELRLTSSDSRGRAILWAGVAVGPRIRLDSDVIARAPQSQPVDYISRMFGLVGGELMWASENMIGDSDFETEFTGRLQRVEAPGKEDSDG